MQVLKVNDCHAYNYNNYIIGNITHKKVYYTNKGSYIIHFGRRVYLNDFRPSTFTAWNSKEVADEKASY